MMKKMILFIIDSLHPAVFGRLLAEGDVPALSFLASKGNYYDRVVSCFPTMTPVAMSSIITGNWPNRHGVPGFIWYDEEMGRIIDYGATWKTVLKLGPEKVVRNLLNRLNSEHLNPKIPTIYEKLEGKGFKTGNINFFIFRALNEYLAKVPLAISLATGFKLFKEKVLGPSFLTIGDFVHPPLRDRFFAFPRGIFHRFGFNDVFSAKIAAQTIREGEQPDFMVVYFPDNDKFSHQKGPLRTRHSIERVDRQIGQVLDAFSSWEDALQDNVVILTGDHSQTTIGLGDEYQIDLNKALRSFDRLKKTETLTADKQIAICANERMAFIYLLQDEEETLKQIVGILSHDIRNTQIAWSDGPNRYWVVQGGTERKLFFTRSGPYHDLYGQEWDFQGDLSVIDVTVTPDGRINYGKYPDPLGRLIAALEARGQRRIVVSAAPGCEYFTDDAPIHPGGGSHGSLEEEDSLVPMIIAGTDQTLENPRIIDLYGFVLKHFGVE